MKDVFLKAPSSSGFMTQLHAALIWQQFYVYNMIFI